MRKRVILLILGVALVAGFLALGPSSTQYRYVRNLRVLEGLTVINQDTVYTAGVANAQTTVRTQTPTTNSLVVMPNYDGTLNIGEDAVSGKRCQVPGYLFNYVDLDLSGADIGIAPCNFMAVANTAGDINVQHISFIPGGYCTDGTLLHIVCNTSNSDGSFVDNDSVAPGFGNLFLESDTDFDCAGRGTLHLVCYNNYWYEISRSENL